MFISSFRPCFRLFAGFFIICNISKKEEKKLMSSPPSHCFLLYVKEIHESSHLKYILNYFSNMNQFHGTFFIHHFLQF